MRLPSSSSLLLVASLASSSSLSALAAPTGDCPEDSSPASASLSQDDTSIQSNSKSTSCTTATFASDIITDNPQSRALLNNLPPPLDGILGAIVGGIFDDKKLPKARAGLSLDGLEKPLASLTDNVGVDRRAAPAEESGKVVSPQDSSSPANPDADPDGSEQSPAPPAAPSPPAPPKLPLEAPVQLPGVKPPVGAPAPRGPPAGRRDASDVVAVAGLMSPPPPRNPPNTPVQRQLPISNIPVELPLSFPTSPK